MKIITDKLYKILDIKNKYLIHTITLSNIKELGFITFYNNIDKIAQIVFTKCYNNELKIQIIMPYIIGDLIISLERAKSVNIKALYITEWNDEGIISKYWKILED